ncbi:hypothetical protein RUM44_006928 [Polyplax serrata]|uniref:E3 ubiquitin-protein ligase SHPRH n=1 Tax=Polyplax serrata TaxID=468196 RepID=A0ABR1AZA4_POLSC
MPKRKNSCPVRLTEEESEEINLSFRGCLSYPNRATKKNRVSFGDTTSNESVIIGNFKKKKVLKNLIPDGIVLGELSFPINVDQKIDVEFNNVDYSIIPQETNDSKMIKNLMLKITSVFDKSVFTCVNLEINDALSVTIRELLTHRYFWVINNPCTLGEGICNITIVTTAEKLPIPKAENIVNLFFGKAWSKPNSHVICTKKVIDEFYREIQEYQKERLEKSDKDVQHEALIPALRPYQARAVQWMTFRESENLETQDTNWFKSVNEIYNSKCGRILYYNKYIGTLSVQKADFPPFQRGGILADEMGLGKTVAIISLILNHPPEPHVEYNKDVMDAKAVETISSQKITISRESLKEKEEMVALNKEHCLNAHEKLVFNDSKGSALKRALEEWYVSKLAECSPGSQSKYRRTLNTDNIKCVCGNTSGKSNDECVQCPDCKRYQHSNCVGFNPKFRYFCPSCWGKQKLVKSSATLIAAPGSIYYQWFDEIKKHVKPEGFKNGVLMYNGLKDGFIQPSVLASYDIVIATYSTVGAEINHANHNQSERKLKNEARFMKMCSPLCQVYWWRLCLDEAQMVENDHSQINQMVNMISAVNRWSVTGTPIQKSINELYYLIDWLGIEPFTEKTLWNQFLYRPYLEGNKIPMYSVMSKIFWRNSKEDVAAELQLPDQKVKYHSLKFTAIEQNFYMREHTMSSTDFMERLKRLKLDPNTTTESVDKRTLTSVLTPLLNLRQACSHPMAVKGNKISSKTGSMTLTALLEYLFNKTKVECEEGMRQYVGALNGLAGIHAILEEWETAVSYYRQVLQFTEEYKDKIQIDSLQRIHTMTNLAEVLAAHSEGIPPTLRDGSLKTEAKILEDKYMQTAISDLMSDENLLKGLTSKVSELESKFETEVGVWWNRMIHTLTIEGSTDELQNKIESELATNAVENKKQVDLFLSKVSSVKGIEITLRKWLSDIEENRTKSLKQLDKLRETPCEDLVNKAVDCHLRTLELEVKKKKCQLCQCESVLLDYECTLFDVSRKVLKENYEKVLDGAQTKGSWRPRKAEKCLRALLSLGKTKSTVEQWCVKDGKTHLLLLEAMKKEFKQLRAVWMSLNHRVQAMDEISMCKLRLRLRLPDEPPPPKMAKLALKQHNETETIFIISPHEVHHNKLNLLANLELSKSEFKKKYGTLLYLQNLGQKENPKPEPCPVCKSVLDNEWCVLQCGHSYCIDCIRIMLTRTKKTVIGCPICRETTKGCDLSFIDLSGNQENSDITVAGDHSTKVDGIIRSLLQLSRENPKVKVLIFSTWAVVLQVLEIALTQNGISFRRMPGVNYQNHLKQFKDPNLNVTVLLLPLSWGSKGLNLTEASHVFLVEPIMNPAEEAQAIGRIHRIGQTKETVVHRFLISGTIEEKIHVAVSEAKDKWGDKKVTFEDLKNLFDMKNDYLGSSACDTMAVAGN